MRRVGERGRMEVSIKGCRRTVRGKRGWRTRRARVEKGNGRERIEKEILIAWQVRLFRNIQHRCTECEHPVPPSLSLLWYTPGSARVETAPCARMVRTVFCLAETITLCSCFAPPSGRPFPTPLISAFPFSIRYKLDTSFLRGEKKGEIIVHPILRPPDRTRARLSIKQTNGPGARYLSSQ